MFYNFLGNSNIFHQEAKFLIDNLHIFTFTFGANILLSIEIYLILRAVTPIHVNSRPWWASSCAWPFIIKLFVAIVSDGAYSSKSHLRIWIWRKLAWSSCSVHIMRVASWTFLYAISIEGEKIVRTSQSIKRIRDLIRKRRIWVKKTLVLVEDSEDGQIPIEFKDIRIVDKRIIVPISKVYRCFGGRVVHPSLVKDISLERNSLADSSIKVVDC